ncbi:hypothetical protein FA15DRAFT_669082 [Coprinopsis marcescibilis]|uniref:Uncharacterized protein n=1 Tax=Coprinopsis marcescibilis TaxID=230819 RepID=A0A5C3KW47_COPMA|nr:hypothetical protein FA15DRAFT_669082 [Coprinopsis marcescibilis]
MDTPAFYGRLEVFAETTVIDRENYRVAWETAGSIPSWLLHSERWQTLTRLPDGRTKYETQEVFRGALAYIVKWVLGSALSSGFHVMAETLKQRAEQQH